MALKMEALVKVGRVKSKVTIALSVVAFRTWCFVVTFILSSVNEFVQVRGVLVIFGKGARGNCECEEDVGGVCINYSFCWIPLFF